MDYDSGVGEYYDMERIEDTDLGMVKFAASKMKSHAAL